MLDFTAKADVSGRKFDGVDIFLSLPHTNIDSSDDELKTLADKVGKRGLVIGSLVAPLWAVPRRRRHRWGPRRAARRRGRDLLGRHAQLEAHGRAARTDRPEGCRRLPGR